MSAGQFVGGVVALVGYGSGGLLVAAPFAPALSTSTLALALLFPGCLAIGIPLLATGPGRSAALRLCGWGLLLMGLAALLGIFATASGLHAAEGLLPLWLITPLALSGGLLLHHFAGALQRIDQAQA